MLGVFLWMLGDLDCPRGVSGWLGAYSGPSSGVRGLGHFCGLGPMLRTLVIQGIKQIERVHRIILHLILNARRLLVSGGWFGAGGRPLPRRPVCGPLAWRPLPDPDV